MVSSLPSIKYLKEQQQVNYIFTFSSTSSTIQSRNPANQMLQMCFSSLMNRWLHSLMQVTLTLLKGYEEDNKSEFKIKFYNSYSFL